MEDGLAADAAGFADEGLMRSVLDSLRSRIAVLDGDGTVVAVNRAWAEFSRERSNVGMCSASQGTNYPDLLAGLAAAGDPYAAIGLQELRAVLCGDKTFASLEYEVRIDGLTRWYLARARPLHNGRHGVIVTHAEITDRMMSRMALEDANRRLQSLSHRLLAVQEEERRALSTELREDIGQSLSALVMSLHRLAEAPAAEGATADCIAVAQASLERIRRLALELHPPQLEDLGLADALGWIASSHAQASGVAIECRCTGLDSRRLPAAIEGACFNIVREGVEAAIRHAEPRRIEVDVVNEGRLLKLSLRIEGESAPAGGMPSGSGCCHGALAAMEERARLAGGRLKVRPVHGKGIALSATFPLVERAAALYC